MTDPTDLAAAQRARRPELYWCIGFTNRSPLYFWNEEYVSKEEYLRARPDEER